MKKSTLRTVELISKKEKIGIFGDYDVDGASFNSFIRKLFFSIKFRL